MEISFCDIPGIRVMNIPGLQALRKGFSIGVTSSSARTKFAVKHDVMAYLYVEHGQFSPRLRGYRPEQNEFFVYDSESAAQEKIPIVMDRRFGLQSSSYG